MNLESMKEKYNILCPNSPAQIVYIPKANKLFLVAFRKDMPPFSCCTITIMDEAKGLAPVAEIRYQIHSYDAYISHFHTNYDYQGKGLGKYLYQLAQGHCDKIGINMSHGVISPLDDIKGVTIPHQDCDKAERRFLRILYHAMGNEIVEETQNGKKITKFQDQWKENEKYSKLDPTQQKFVEDMITYEKYLFKLSEQQNNKRK